MNLKSKQKFKITLVLLSIFLLTNVALANDNIINNNIINAMRDEMKRSMEDLSLESLQKPYYIEYTISVKEPKNIQANLGAVTVSADSKAAYLNVAVRVGDYKFDNTNYFDIGLSFFGSSDDEERFKKRLIPVEANYKNLRRELWLSTDAAYKQAAELYSKKEAAIKNRLRKDTTHDFLPIEPTRRFIADKPPEFDMKEYENLVESLSGIFNNYPEIISSSVGIEYLPKTVYYINSEGVEYIRTDLFTGIEIAAYTQAGDGMPLANYFTAFSLAPKDLPAPDSLRKAAIEVAEKLMQIRDAPILDEPYSGPVLFTGNAAAELFAQSFAPNLVAQREPLTDRGKQENDRYSAFQTKIGGRVLPEFLSVDAIPEYKTYANTPLIGHFEIDDNGILTANVNLINNGYLKTLLSSRVPTRRIRKSNGHKRGGAPMLSNIILESDKEHKKSLEELKEKMLKLCADRELPYGIMAKKIMDNNIMFTTLYRLAYGNYKMPRGAGKLAPVEVYKVYPDGREELVRGAEAVGFTVQTFKDILYVGREGYVMNYLAPSVISSYVSGGDQYIGGTIISPDLLFEDGEIRPMDEDFRKPPVLANPIGE